MKRVLILLLITVSAISVSAQRDYRNNDRNERYHYKHDRKKGIRARDNNNRHEFRRQIGLINHQFDSKVNSIRKNPFMSRNQKNRRIQELEMHRRVALKECRDRFSRRDFVRGRQGHDRRR